MTAKENTKNILETLSMIVAETAHEYVARATVLAGAAKHHGVEVADEEICRCILNGPPPALNVAREGFDLKDGFSLNELESVPINAEELKKQPGRSNGHALVLDLKPRSSQGGRGGGRGGRISGGGHGSLGVGDSGG